jgi:head-tail adaptor
MANDWLFGSNPSVVKPPARRPVDSLFFNPGLANTSITILQQVSTVDVSGATPGWTVFATAWAQVKALRGADQWKSGQFTSEKYMQVTMWYLPGVLSNMRITFADSGTGNTRTLVVQDAVNVDERSTLHQLLCVELDGQ